MTPAGKAGVICLCIPIEPHNEPLADDLNRLWHIHCWHTQDKTNLYGFRHVQSQRGAESENRNLRFNRFFGKGSSQTGLDAGYQIRTLVRNPDKLGEFKDKVEFVQGSISEVDKLEETVRGTEVVLSSVGPPQRNPEKPEFYKKAMTDLVGVRKSSTLSVSLSPAVQSI